jgi:hypothetical protein
MAEYRPTPETVLQYLYGLLESAEADRVSAWLATPAGEAARRDAERERRMIATAAKVAFSNVRFERPTLSMPTDRANTAKRKWAGWLVAAGLLVAAGFPFARHAIQEQHLRGTVELARAKLSEVRARQQQWQQARRETLDSAHQRVVRTQGKLDEIQAEFEKSAQRVAEEIQSKQLSLVISGPESVRAGVANEFRIQTLDGANQPTPATVLARVKDRDDRIVFEEKLRGDVGVEYKFQLPADMPLTPNRDLFLELSAQREAGPKTELREQLQLAVPDYFTHLTTDKPLYQPGETVYFRSLSVDRFSLKPPPDDFHIQYVIQDPKQTETEVVRGATRLIEGQSPVLGPDGQPLRGIGAGEWPIPAEAPGGEYTLVVRELQNRFPETKRRFLVNQYRPEQIEKVLEWSRRSYGPGDVVVANCKATLSNGQPLVGGSVSASATVDGQPIPIPAPSATDEAGRVAIRFELPKSIAHGAGSLNIAFGDGANSESLNKPIPIALKKLDVEFYPEGGELIAGTPNRVYFRVRTTLGKPADIQGRIVDGGGREVARIATLTDDVEPGINQGLGRFDLTPEFGQKYRLVIENPVGIEGEHSVPEVRSDGVVLTALGDITAEPDPITVRVASMGIARNVLVGAYARGRLLDHRRVSIPANANVDVALKPEGGIGGVTRITVFEELAGQGTRATLKPVAERLVYRKPTANLLLTVKPDRPNFSPGDRARLKVAGFNESEKPTAAVLYLGVVNQSVVTMADEKTWRSLPTHFLLTSEIQQPEELEHADVLLGAHPKAATALDLLLGTQGWRRFVDRLPGESPKKAAAEAERVMVANNWNADRRRETTSLELGIKKLEQKLTPEFEATRQSLREAENAVVRLSEDPQAAETARLLAADAAAASASLQTARNSLDQLGASWRQTKNWLLPALCGFALLAAIIAVIVGIANGLRWQIPAAVSLSVAVIGVILLANHVNDARNVDAMPATEFAAVAAGNAMPEPKSGVERHDAGIREIANEARRDNLRFGGGQPATGSPAPNAKPGTATRPMAPVPGAPAPTPAIMEDKAQLKANDKDSLIERPGIPADKVDGAKAAGKLGRPGAAIGEEIRKRDARRAQSAADAKKLAEAQREISPAGIDEIKNQLRLPAQASPVPMPGPIGGGGAGGAFPGRGGFAADPQSRVRMLRKELAPPPPEPLVVRQYAHQRAPASGEGRSDFAETLFWHPALVVPVGGAEVAFDLSDAVGRYQVLAAGHTLDGRLGSVTTYIEARKPLSLEPKLPVEITAGDRVVVPLSVVNDSSTARSVAINVKPTSLNLGDGHLDTTVQLAPEQRQRQNYAFTPEIVEGKAQLQFEGKSDGAADSIAVQIPVVANGFPIVGSISDSLERVAQHQIVLPNNWVPGTLHCQVSVFPSTLAELQRGLEGLLREPGGCFEQTSTTNYPNTLILEYLRESEQPEPEAMRRARDMLQRGYAKLTSFEVASANKREGFEWFGQFPAHEALTAYGLMQFRDMARVSDVDPMLLQRTRDFLLSRRDGRGGFQRNPQALDTFGRAPDEVTNAYIVWALTESGKEDDVTMELDALSARARQSKDPYFLALVANALLNRDRHEEALAILRNLTPNKDGCLDGAQTSITGSSGRTLQIETTSLAVLGWLKANRPSDFAANIRSAVTWIGQQRGGYGGFGSTQSTILALKALIAFTKANKQSAESGTLKLYFGDKLIGERPYKTGESGELTIPIANADQLLKPGKNDLRIEMSGKNTYPYALTWSYRSLQPPNDENCAVRLTTKLDKSDIAESDAAQVHVTLENVSGRGQGMTVAIVGLPAGLKLPDDFKQLREMARLRPDGKSGPIGAFEIRGRELILYWRDLAPDAKIDLAIDVRGHVPGEYTGPASRAYLYYNSDAKHWTAPLKAVIRASD